MSRSGDFCGDDNRQTDRQTDYFTPAHARGVTIAFASKMVKLVNVFSLESFPLYSGDYRLNL